MAQYTTQLQAGLGLVEETKLLLSIYSPGMSVAELHTKALESGLFPNVSARRLRNMIAECFAPRYLKPDVARHLAPLSKRLPPTSFNQLLLVFTALANRVLLDFIREVYWNKYAGGGDSLSTEESRRFVVNAVQDGKTQSPWSESTIRRVSSYLIGACADYGLLSSSRSSDRRIQSVRIQDSTTLFLAYWLHFNGHGDNAMLTHEIWGVFGLSREDVKEELKQIAKNGHLIVQSAGTIVQIGWKHNNIEEVVDVILAG